MTLPHEAPGWPRRASQAAAPSATPLHQPEASGAGWQCPPSEGRPSDRDRLWKAIEGAVEAVALLDSRGRHAYHNRAHARVHGYEAGALLGQAWTVLFERDEARRVRQAVMPCLHSVGRWRGEVVGRRWDGSLGIHEVSLTALPGGETLCVTRDRDATEGTILDAALACVDPLTGLPNRRSFGERLEAAIRSAHAQRERLALIFLDLDRFKLINDSLGHAVGDQLLRQIARRLDVACGPADTVARLEGDEFVVLRPVLGRAGDDLRLAQRLLAAVRPPLVVGDREIFVTASLGIARYPEHGSDADRLVRSADAAMYRAKDRGRDTVASHSARLASSSLERLSLEGQLRQALPRGELGLYYQLVLDLRTGLPHGVEALIRGNHPTRGVLRPADFLPLAEITGLADAIDSWVLSTACRQVRRWQERFGRSLALAVNLAPRQFQKKHLARQVADALGASGLPPASVELEITETGAMQDLAATRRTLSRLRRLGVRIALDDFGVGHSALSYLKRLSVDTLKIDQSFVAGIPSDRSAGPITAAVITMAHALGVSVVAEGIETAPQAELLASQGCDRGQGYLFGRPVPEVVCLQALARCFESPRPRPGRRETRCP